MDTLNRLQHDIDLYPAGYVSKYIINDHSNNGKTALTTYVLYHNLSLLELSALWATDRWLGNSSLAN